MGVIDALDQDDVAALRHRPRKLVVVRRQAMTLDPDVHDNGRDAATMKTTDDGGVDAAGRRPCSRLHPELLCGALVDTDNDDVRWGRDRTPKREQPPEAELFFQPVRQGR